jgi:ribosomal protein L15
VVNLGALADLPEEVKEITPEVLKRFRLIHYVDRPVKILADGEFDRTLNFIGVLVSKAAKEKIESLQGSVKEL